MIIHWIHTSDVHGHLDALSGIEDYVDGLRRTAGSANLILTDGGDCLQGSPLVYYHNYMAHDSQHVVAKAMNRMRYDCMAVGNHDIEVGHGVYDRVFRQMLFPVLCANIRDYFQPYHIIEKGGLRIAVLSLLTPDTTLWISPSQYSGMEFLDPVESGRHWIAHIREKEHADLMVGLFHIGWEETKGIAERLPELDVILYGHDHHEGIHRVGRTLCAAPSALGTSSVSLRINTETKEMTAEIIANKSQHELQSDADYYHWLHKTIATVDVPLNEADSYFGPSAFLALTHRLMLAATGAQISLAAPVSYDAYIPEGEIRNRDMFTLYNRDSQLYTMRLTLDELKNILEISYSLWTNVMTSPTDHALLLDYVLDDGRRLGLKHFTIDFLTAYGVDYTVDLTQPYGKKINLLSVPEAKEGWVLVAINSYHANGGGNILSRATGLTSAERVQRVVKVEPCDLRQCLMNEIAKAGDIRLQHVDNWIFIPSDWAESALQRDKALLF